jgi:integrase
MSASGHESGRLPSAARRQRLRRRPRSLRGYGQPVGRRRTRTAGAPRSRAASYRVDALAFWTMPSSQAVLADWLPFASIVALLTLTGQRRDEVTKLAWEEVDENTSVWSIAGWRTKNGRPHIVHLSEPALHVLHQTPRIGALAFFVDGEYPFQNFGHAKARLDASADVHSWVLHDLRRTVVNGMARLGIPPHIADKILNHHTGTVSGVAAVYQRHEFLAERRPSIPRTQPQAGPALQLGIKRRGCFRIPNGYSSMRFARRACAASLIGAFDAPKPA